MTGQPSSPAEHTSDSQFRSWTRFSPDKPETWVIIKDERKRATIFDESFGGIGMTIEMADAIDVQVDDDLVVLHNDHPRWAEYSGFNAIKRLNRFAWESTGLPEHLQFNLFGGRNRDGLAEYLAAAGMQFQTHDALKENCPEEAKTAYQTAVELVRQAHSESRRVISEVRPPVIDEIGIETAISHLVPVLSG